MPSAPPSPSLSIGRPSTTFPPTPSRKANETRRNPRRMRLSRLLCAPLNPPNPQRPHQLHLHPHPQFPPHLAQRPSFPQDHRLGPARKRHGPRPEPQPGHRVRGGRAGGTGCAGRYPTSFVTCRGGRSGLHGVGAALCVVAVAFTLP